MTDDDLFSEMLDDDSEVTCRECGEPLEVVTESHLDKHGMTRLEYAKKYPDAPLASEQYKSKCDPTS